LGELAPGITTHAWRNHGRHFLRQIHAQLVGQAGEGLADVEGVAVAVEVAMIVLAAAYEILA